MAVVVIDTDGVRDLARYTRGAVDQVAQIRLELLRAGDVLGTGPGAQRYTQLLADLAGYAAVLSDDHRNLVTEVLTIEQEEGPPPPGWTDVNPSDPGITVLQTPAFLAESLLFRAGGPPAPPPQPWNTTWVSADGTIPLGGRARTTGIGAAGDDAADDFGSAWSQRPAGNGAGTGTGHSVQSWHSFESAADNVGDGQGQGDDLGPVQVDVPGHQRGFAPAVAEYASGYGDLVKDTAKGWGEGVVAVGEGIAEGGWDLVKGVGEAATDLGHGISDAFDDLSDGRVADAVGSLAEGVGEAAVDVAKGVGEDWAAVGHGIGEAAVDIGSGYADGVSAMAHGWKESVVSGGEGMADGAHDVVAPGHDHANDDLFDQTADDTAGDQLPAQQPASGGHAAPTGHAAAIDHPAATERPASADSREAPTVHGQAGRPAPDNP